MSLKGVEMEVTILQDGSQMMDWMSQIFTIFQGLDIDQTIMYENFQKYYLMKNEHNDILFDYLTEIFAVELSDLEIYDARAKKKEAKRLIRDKGEYKPQFEKWDQKLEKERDAWNTKDKNAASKLKLAVGSSYKSQIDSMKLTSAFKIWSFLKEEGVKTHGGARFSAYFDFISLGYDDEKLSDYLTKKQLLYERMKKLDVIITEDIAFIDIVARLPMKYIILKQALYRLTKPQMLLSTLRAEFSSNDFQEKNDRTLHEEKYTGRAELNNTNSRKQITQNVRRNCPPNKSKIRQHGIDAKNAKIVFSSRDNN